MGRERGGRKGEAYNPVRHTSCGDRHGLVFLSRHQSLWVYDVKDPKRPRKVGCFAAPSRSFQWVRKACDGRVIVMGRDKLYVFDPAEIGR